MAAPEKAQKYLLQHVLGVRGVAGHPVGRAENQAVGLLEDSFYGTGGYRRGSLSDCEFQSTPPALSRVKTWMQAVYYDGCRIFMIGGKKNYTNVYES